MAQSSNGRLPCVECVQTCTRNAKSASRTHVDNKNSVRTRPWENCVLAVESQPIAGCGAQIGGSLYLTATTMGLQRSSDLPERCCILVHSSSLCLRLMRLSRVAALVGSGFGSPFDVLRNLEKISDNNVCATTDAHGEQSLVKGPPSDACHWSPTVYSYSWREETKVADLQCKTKTL